MIIELIGINKSYGQGDNSVHILKDINLAIQEGEYVSIMGPSGSGKSTLMNIIGCLDSYDEGSYFLDGKDVSHLSDDEMADIRLNKLGFVFQNFELLPFETAVENVALPLVYAKCSKLERIKKASEMLTKVNLDKRINFYPNQLSGGQKQRVAIARALINQPRIILADEPTGALDQASGKQLMELFKQLNDQGITIVMITHDLDVARNAKRIIRIVDGRIADE